MLAVVNPHAGGGRAWKRWKAIEPWFFSQHPLAQVVVTGGAAELPGLLRASLAKRERVFIAAGGDGTVSAMVNALLTEGGGMENLQRTTIGAIGLGSSNDFHKPYTEGHFVGRLPVKVDDVNAKLCDVGRIEYKDSSGEEAVRHFIINASLGATAHANFFFNHPNWLLRKLKRWSTNLAIGYTAVRTIIGFRNEQVTIKDGAKVRGCGVSNLAVLKRPYFSKDFFYDVPMSLDDGRLSVNLCADMSKLEMLRALRQLTKGRLTSSKWSSWSTEGLGIGTERPIPVETDGEVILAQDIRFSVLARTVRVCC